MNAKPKPTSVLIVASVLVIAFSLLLASVAIAAMAVMWDPCSLIGGIIMLPWPAALAIQQYRGTFRLIRSAASQSAILLFVIGGFAAFSFVAATVEIATADGDLPWFGLLLPMLAMAAFCLFGGWLNWRWRRDLPRNGSGAGWRFSMREVLAVITVMGFFIASTSLLIRSTPPRYAENVSAAEAPFGLPANATDVSFCQGYRGIIAYEFTIDEMSFRDWVAVGIGSIESNSSNTKLQTIAEPISITRYHLLSADLHGPDSVTVTSGLHYSWSSEDRGVYAVFDSTTNRAYYFAHFH